MTKRIPNEPMSAHLLDRILRDRFPRPLHVAEVLKLLGGPTERTLFRYRKALTEQYGAKILWRDGALSYEEYPDWCFDLFGDPGSPLAPEQKVSLLVTGMINREVQTFFVRRKQIHLFPAYIVGVQSNLFVVGAQFDNEGPCDHGRLVNLPIMDIGAWVGVRKFPGDADALWKSLKMPPAWQPDKECHPVERAS